MKNRFGPDGITFPCKMDTNTGFIEVYEGTSTEGILSTKESASRSIRKETITPQKVCRKYGIVYNKKNIFKNTIRF